MLLEKCCFCINLRTGSIIIAIINTLWWLLGFGYRYVDGLNGVLLIVFFVFYIALAVLSILFLIFGIYKDMHRARKTYANDMLVKLLGDIGIGVWLTIKRKNIALPIISYTVITAFYDIYIFLVMYSYFIKANPESEPLEPEIRWISEISCLAKCCFFVNLRTGSIIIAFINTLWWLIGVGYWYIDRFGGSLLISVVVIYVLLVIVSISFLIFGIYMDMTKPKRAYAYDMILKLFGEIVIGIWLTMERDNKALSITYTVFSAIYDIYIFLVLYSYYVKTKPEIEPESNWTDWLW